MSRIKFGTDGWRAVIAEDFTFTNVARVAQATADELLDAWMSKAGQVPAGWTPHVWPPARPTC